MEYDRELLARISMQAEENAAKQLLCDVLAGFAKLHEQVPTYVCVDPFGDAPCRFDDTLASTVANIGRQ